VVLNEHKTRVRELAAEFNLSHPSREPLDLAAAIGAKLEYGDLGDKDGAFDPNRNVIFISKTVTLERQRFTMAHEVTHALILADEDLLSDLHDAYEGDDLEEAIEILCNVGASAILVPESELEALLQKYRALSKVLRSHDLPPAWSWRKVWKAKRLLVYYAPKAKCSRLNLAPAAAKCVTYFQTAQSFLKITPPMLRSRLDCH
jgi:hypothetical protein